MAVVYKKGQRFGPFSVVRPLSDGGGMAMVYEAEVTDDRHPVMNGKKVALKVARVDGHADIYETLLRRETNHLIQLRHPGIVRICPISIGGRVPQQHWYGKGEAPPHDYYFAMELLSGGSLAQFLALPIRDLKNYMLEWRVELLYQLAQTLDYLHMRRMAHRDLKPENIMFRTRPEPLMVPQPVLIDFGLTQKTELREESNTRKQVRAATIAYASPAWIRARQQGRNATAVQPDPSAFDMWSLGMVAYQLLNVRYAFGRADDQATLLEQRILREEPERMNDDVPPALQNLVRSLLQKEDGDRLTSNGFLHALESVSSVVSPRF
ncbi:MAG: serine/threonine-protein kinase [Chloroflexota bacterium]|nr:serine/threonine-protein kinase [Chloroflexota bacterium]